MKKYIEVKECSKEELLPDGMPDGIYVVEGSIRVIANSYITPLSMPLSDFDIIEIGVDWASSSHREVKIRSMK